MKYHGSARFMVLTSSYSDTKQSQVYSRKKKNKTGTSWNLPLRFPDDKPHKSTYLPPSFSKWTTPKLGFVQTVT